MLPAHNERVNEVLTHSSDSVQEGVHISHRRITLWAGPVPLMSVYCM